MLFRSDPPAADPPAADPPDDDPAWLMFGARMRIMDLGDPSVSICE